MKKHLFLLCFPILFILFTSCNLFSQVDVFPKPIGYVNDFENVFTKEENNELELLISDFEVKTSNEIAIVSIDSIGNYDDFDKFALDLSKKWGVGKKNKDNGLTIVFSKKLRRIRINTGIQTEKILTNEICKKIIDEKIIPEFKKDNYFVGVKNSLLELIQIWEK